MATTIRYAGPEDEEPLRDLLLHYDMDLAGAIDEHVLVQEDERIIAGGMLSQVKDDRYHLEVLAVRDEQRRTGAGRLLLSAMMGAPWQYCRAASPGAVYSITLVARGDVVPFYSKCGFEPCSFLELAAPHRLKCTECPDKQSCQPTPMIFRRGIAR